MRRDKDNYYLDIAESVLQRGTCLRRNYGALIVKNDSIIATGYTGAPRGRQNCIDLKSCRRSTLGVPRGERYELCRSVHAEANAIISSSYQEMLGATLYLVGKDVETDQLIIDANSCAMCKRLIINAGIERIVIRQTHSEFVSQVVEMWVEEDDSLGGISGY